MGGLGDLDFGSAPAQNNDFLGDMMGNSQPTTQEPMDFGFGGGFGTDTQEDDGGTGWADAFEDEGFDA